MDKIKIFLAVYICIIVGFCFLFLASIAVLYPIKYKNEILNTSIKTGVSPVLIASVINAESRFRPQIVSNKGAIGLMQLMPTTAKEVAIELGILDFSNDDLLDPSTNILLGTQYLSNLLDEFYDTTTALAAYNAGPNRVREWLQNPDYSTDGKTISTCPFTETNDYIAKIMHYQKFYINYF